MDLMLEGKVAVITGASRGIGAAAARLLAAEGARLVLNARDGGRLAATAAEIRRAAGAEVVDCAADLTEKDAAARVAEAACAAFARIDILVNAAGDARGGIFWEIDDAVWDEALGLKFFATVRMIRAVLPAMRAQKAGRIVTVVGNAGRQPGPRALPGAAANAALLAVTGGLAREVAPDGIFVNAVNPGPTLTDRWSGILAETARATGRALEEVKAEITRDIPTGRFGTADEVARAIAFLASDCTANITGTSITCDGGMTRAIA